jgi:hypothetical protein
MLGIRSDDQNASLAAPDHMLADLAASPDARGEIRVNCLHPGITRDLGHGLVPRPGGIVDVQVHVTESGDCLVGQADVLRCLARVCDDPQRANPERFYLLNRPRVGVAAGEGDVDTLAG